MIPIADVLEAKIRGYWIVNNVSIGLTGIAKEKVRIEELRKNAQNYQKEENCERKMVRQE